MDLLAWDQVQAWIGTTRRGVVMLRRSNIAPLKAIEVSERLYGMLQEYLIEAADILGRDVTDAFGALTFMHVPIIADPNLPFEFEPLVDQPTIVATSLDAVATFEEKQPGISRLIDVVFVPPPDPLRL
jgi:hypothetical protein